MTTAAHRVAQYANMSLLDALNLSCDLFMLCLKNWEIERLQMTEEGRAYLEDCERYKKTKIDRAGLNRLRNL